LFNVAAPKNNKNRENRLPSAIHSKLGFRTMYAVAADAVII
jgi:hypothetical protein